jgi:hypothetical protein
MPSVDGISPCQGCTVCCEVRFNPLGGDCWERLAGLIHIFVPFIGPPGTPTNEDGVTDGGGASVHHCFESGEYRLVRYTPFKILTVRCGREGCQERCVL